MNKSIMNTGKMFISECPHFHHGENEDNFEFLHVVEIKLGISASKQAVREKQSQHLACTWLVSSWL